MIGVIDYVGRNIKVILEEIKFFMDAKDKFILVESFRKCNNQENEICAEIPTYYTCVLTDIEGAFCNII